MTLKVNLLLPACILLASMVMQGEADQKGKQGSQYIPQAQTIECSDDNYCPSTLSCILNTCIDPCEYYQSSMTCQPNSHCVTSNHQPYCYCNFGYVFDMDNQCVKDANSTWHDGDVTDKKNFVILEEQASWENAFKLCTDRGLRLAKIDNKTQNSLAVRILKDRKTLWGGFWIAGRYDKDTNGWWWNNDAHIKGKPIAGYTNWQTLRFGDCLSYCSISPISIFVKKGYRWTGKPCKFKLSVLCEYNY